MATSLNRALAHLFALCLILPSRYLVESNSNNVAQNLSYKLHEYADQILKYRKLQKRYESDGDLELKLKNGKNIAKEMRKALQRVLSSKIDSVKLLSRKAEALKRNYTDRDRDDLKKVRFYNSKNLKKLGSNLSMAIDPTFSEKIPVSFNNSVIHVPTDVYEGNETILNIIEWTKGLNEQFRQNSNNKNNHLLWQYFGTNKGVYRFYPGHGGLSKDKMFDNRKRGWYIQGSSSPKDMVIVLDLSGSVVGSKLAIIKLSAVSLLDTLQENDFVNVVLFNKGAKMLCNGSQTQVKGQECVKGLLQATDRNKRYLKSLIHSLKAENVADADAGFRLAFELLKNASRVSESSRCFKLINFFTDGIESSVREKSLKVMEENIQKKDKDKVRIFSYLIGREKAVDDKPVKEFACKNNGYYFRIETLSDVREKVLGFMNVLSRPLVLSGDNNPTWVPVYVDNMGLGMMTSVVIPVFDSNDTNGALLGVVGTDVPLPLITNTVPQYKVGVNGYGFAINNNGFLLFHPKLKREDHYKNLKEDPNVYLTEVEFASGNQSDLKKLIKAMINRSTSDIKLETEVISSDERRVTKRNYTFYYTLINDTSFSSAVAIPDYDKFRIEVNTQKDYLDKLKTIFQQTHGNKVVISPWEYCEIISKAQTEKPMYIPSELYPTVEELVKNLTGETSIPEYCDISLLKHLLDDANKTKDHVDDTKQQLDEKEEILSLFIGTDSGLTRFLTKPSPNKTVTVPRDLYNQEFYSRTADYVEESKGFLIISTDNSDIENIQINITTPIILERNGNKTLAAVLGMQIKAEAFNELFRNTTQTDCPNDSETISCYMLDDDAYVVASNQDNYTEIGKFFGEVNGVVMRDMVNKSIYRRVELDDSQRICNEQSSDSSSAIQLLNPLWAVKAYMQWWTQTVFWSAVQFNLYSYFWQQNIAVAQDTTKTASCTKTLTFYKAQAQSPSGNWSLSCSNCNGYEVVRVNNTNLLFVKTDCACKTPKLLRKPKEKKVKPFTAPDENFREAPQLKCYKYNENEDTSDCGSGSALKPTLVLIAIVLIVNLLISQPQ